MKRLHCEDCFLLSVLLCAGLSDGCRLRQVLVKLMGITAHLSRFYDQNSL